MKKLFSVCLSALLCLVGCTNEEIANVAVKKGSIQASFESDMSRLAVGQGNALTWSAGDAFVMFDRSNASSVWTLEGNGGSATGVFSGKELEELLVGAAFPASASPNYQWGDVTMTLPSTLEYQEGICNLPMWAKFSSLEGEVSFNHLAALLKIDFKDIPEGYNSLTVKASKSIAGTFNFNANTQEPVLALKENGSNSVTVTFNKIEGTDNDRLFYLPLPVGEYASINVSISDGENTLSIADWKDRSIVRKKVYLASLTYRVSDATTPTAVNSELQDMVELTSTPSIEIAGQIKAEDGNIVIPAEAKNVNLDFQTAPSTSSAAPLTFVEETGAGNATLVVSLPDASTDANVKFDMPNTTVQVAGGNYATIVARTAAHTLVLGEGTTVKDLVILGGNVALRGGKVTGSITRDASNTDVIYVYVDEEDDLEGVTLGTGVQKVFADYVTFTADAEQTFRFSKEVQTMEYSVGGSKWTELGSSTVVFGGDKGTLRLRGKNGLGTSVSTVFNDRSSVVFGDLTVSVAASGNILTLADYENYNSEGFDTSNVRFSNLFMGCSNLTSAPELPATTLADYCYVAMFSGCTGLTEAPELPATTLTNYCYASMFNGCSGLTEAPVLPATTLADYCYEMMFRGCTGLTEAPELPNTTLADYCYNGMFFGCTGLTEPPVLPATTLANYCYQSMFYGCTGLTETPELPATTLADYCYDSMFYGCTALTKAQNLSATTLANFCCYMMFYGCTALTDAPALPATTLAKGCYENMFRGCSSLTVAPKLPATTLADYCYRYMLQDCNLAEAPELPATTLAEWCYSGMFINNKNLTKSPVLPALTLTNRSYTWMFEGCSGLTEVTMLATDVSASECLSGWLNGVPATGTFYKSASIEDVSAYNIPEDWEVKDYTPSSNTGDESLK